MVLTRNEVAEQDRWNVASLYPSFEAWNKDFEKANRSDQDPKWPEIAAFQGHLHESPQMIREALIQIFDQARQIEKLYTYAHLRHDEDIANEANKSAYNKILSLYYQFSKETAWFEPEILAIDPQVMERALNSPELKEFRFHIEKILRRRKHTLSPKEEKLLALAGPALMGPSKAFSALNDADFNFGQAIDSEGKEHEITHASYALYMRSQDRELRRNTFERYHKQFAKYENTLTELINGQVQAHLFNAHARNYATCLEAALYPKNIDVNFYHALIEAANRHIAPLHKYVALRKKILGVDKLYTYDLQVPLIKSIDIMMPYKEAEEIVIESVAPLGPEYQNILRKGLKEERWVDRYENKHKRSGAYSSGCFDSQPYILMNYKNLLRDVFTLAHEAGHSMHSHYSRTSQPYWYSDYPIFIAEVASTFNEDLLMRLMIERAKSKEEKIFLINQKIDDIRGTLFRQTLFAAFELALHNFAEKQIPLTPQLLKETYRNLNQKLFGDALQLDESMEIEWARIPHFYYNFYVFQYATGISAALALTDRVIGGGKTEQNDYINFLKSGSSLYPIEIMQLAGVDMRSPEPVLRAIDKFSRLVDQLEDLYPRNLKTGDFGFAEAPSFEVPWVY
jgi:oligoendopeptidase F